MDRDLVHQYCLKVLLEGGEVDVDEVGIWTREVGYLDDPHGWTLTFCKCNAEGEDETAGVIRDTMREYILEHLDDYDDAVASLGGLCFGGELSRKKGRRRPGIR